MSSQVSRSCALPEGLRHYLLRDNVMVPLVPVDQLPFQLQGVPRRLNHRQLSEQRWKFVEETSEPASPLPILTPTTRFCSQPTPIAKHRFLAPDHHVRADSSSMHSDEPRSARSSLTPPFPVAQKAPDMSRSVNLTLLGHTSSTDGFASIYQKDTQRIGCRAPYPSGIEPDPSKKEYCTHWIKTGECAFISIGCKYKHEMPTAEKLRELGFTQGLPKWWKEKSALGSRGSTWMQRRLAGADVGESSNEVPARRAFPEPRELRMRRHALHPIAANIEAPFDTPEYEHSVSALKVTREDAAAPPTISKQDTMLTTTKTATQISNLLIDIDETPAPPPSPQLSHNSLTSGEFSDEHVLCEYLQTLEPSTPFTQQKTPFKTNEAEAPNTHDDKSPKTTGRQLMIDKGAPLKAAPGQCAKASVEVMKDDIHTIRPDIRRHSELSWASSSEDDLECKKPLSKHTPITNKPLKGACPKRAPSKHSGLAISKHAKHNKNAEHHSKSPNRKPFQHKVLDVAVPKLQADITQLRRTGQQKGRARRGAVSAESQARTTWAAIVPMTQTTA